MKFAQAIGEQTARTTNGMMARKSTANACVDLFFKIGGSRGKDITKEFIAALVENEEYALRIAQYARDVRGGMGERQLYIDILRYLANNNPGLAMKLVVKTPVVGRWKDLLSLADTPLKDEAFALIEGALTAGDGLCAKWMPRKKFPADELRKFMGLHWRDYRKLLVKATRVVESQMCSNDWDGINFSHVPSLAMSRYRKAFGRHTPKFLDYLNAVKKGEKKINAKAVYPYDVLKGVRQVQENSAEGQAMLAQWDALPNFVGDEPVLAMVDVSGSMTQHRINESLNCKDVAVSLGLYLADKLSGPFAGCFLTFTDIPVLYRPQGNVIQKFRQSVDNNVGYNTNIDRAIQLILDTGIRNNVRDEDMPKILVILSDMQFDKPDIYLPRGRSGEGYRQGFGWDPNAVELFTQRYADAGYTLPRIVFWNLHGKNNVPARFDQTGVAMVSGFSPAVMKAILKGDGITPEAVMLQAIMADKYAI